MSPETWIRENYHVFVGSMGTTIAWGNGLVLSGYYTPVDKFIEMFGGVMQTAINDNNDVKQAIRGSDPENVYGFNDIM